MNFLGVATIELLLPFILSLAVIGSAVKWGFGVIRFRTLRPPPLFFRDPVGRVALDFALGTTVVPIFYLVATVTDARIAAPVAISVVALSIAILILRILRSGTGRLMGFLNSVSSQRWEIVGLALLSVGALAMRLAPYWTNYVYAGDDIRYYTLITQLISANGHFVASYGPYGSGSWIVTTDGHLFFSGSEAIYAFSLSWFSGGAPQLVSAGTLLYNTAIPVSVYVFVRALFPTQTKWVALSSAAVLGVVASYPLFMLQWGGIDETIAWFLVPIALAILVSVRSTGESDWVEIVVAGLFVGGMGLITPLAIIYLVAFIGPFLLEAAGRRERFKATSVRWAAILGFATLVMSPMIFAATLTSIETGAKVVPGSFGWGTFQNYALLNSYNPGGDLNRVLTLATGTLYSAFVVVLGLVGLLLRVRTRWVGTILGWSLVLFLLNENGPFGLYWIKYPGWTAVYPDRTAHLLFVPLSIGTGLLVGSLVAMVSTLHPSLPKPSRALTRYRIRRTAGAVTLAVLVVAAGVVATNILPINNGTVRYETALTSEDLAGFSWLAEHASSNSTVLIDQADSGSWIPEFTGLRAFPYPELINNISVMNQYDQMVQELPDGNFSEFAVLTHTYAISYVYYGERWAGGLVNPTLPQWFEVAPPAWNYVSSSHLCKSPTNNVSVSLYCTNDTVTFDGPIILNVTFELGNVSASTLVPVPLDGQYTYTLGPESPNGPYSYARISTVPLAQSVFADENVLILELNSLCQSLATGPVERS